jgi:hypothetical protein
MAVSTPPMKPKNISTPARQLLQRRQLLRELTLQQLSLFYQNRCVLEVLDDQVDLPVLDQVEAEQRRRKAQPDTIRRSVLCGVCLVCVV